MKYTKEYLEPIVKDSFSVTEVMEKAGVRASGGNHRYWSKLIRQKFQIDTSHFSPHKRQADYSVKSPKEILVCGRKTRTHGLRRAMLQVGIEYKCSRCGNTGAWQGEQMTLEIDHINRDNLDNRKENLHFLCPNCHSLKCKGKI
jgi:predicted RNA-binding Zn-ribbon protein involved in translation (DUF1610 family)